MCERCQALVEGWVYVFSLIFFMHLVFEAF